jgi:hypothetical protein
VPVTPQELEEVKYGGVVHARSFWSNIPEDMVECEKVMQGIVDSGNLRIGRNLEAVRPRAQGFGIPDPVIPLLPVLKAMGVPEQKIREAWGNELFAANAKHDDAKAVDKLFAKIAKVPEGDPEKRRQSVAEFFGKMELDPEVTGRTLGKAYTHLTPDVYLDSVRKLLAVHKGEADSDDRDSLAYQHFMGPEDLIAETVKSAGNALRPLLWRASPRKSLAGMPPNFLGKMIAGAITNSGLGQSLEAPAVGHLKLPRRAARSRGDPRQLVGGLGSSRSDRRGAGT